MTQPLPQRKSVRLRRYDYSREGAYFVTICTHQRAHLFGSITYDEMALNAWGEIAATTWEKIPQHFSQVMLPAFVVMPNHVHGIVVFNMTNLPTTTKTTRQTLGTVIGQYKSTVTRQIKQLPDPPDHPLWQRSFHEHIIRNQKSFDAIFAYVNTNPARWAEDRYGSEG
jgi:putative transposase